MILNLWEHKLQEISIMFHPIHNLIYILQNIPKLPNQYKFQYKPILDYIRLDKQLAWSI